MNFQTEKRIREHKVQWLIYMKLLHCPEGILINSKKYYVTMWLNENERII
jgi:hypothetical protein